MMNYYDEMRNDIKEAIKYDYSEVLENVVDKEDTFETLENIFFTSDGITGNASGSYYFNSYESRLHCYNYSDDVKNALEEFDYTEILEKFQLFENACDYGYIDVENMEIDADTFDELDEYDKEDVLEVWEEIQGLDFEKIDVITRCYLLSEVLTDVLDEIF